MLDFTVEPEFAAELEWMERFVKRECEPLDLLFPHGGDPYDWWMSVPSLALADGPTEVHRSTIAKQVLKDYKPADGLFPSEHIPPRLAAVRARYADIIGDESLVGAVNA